MAPSAVLARPPGCRRSAAAPQSRRRSRRRGGRPLPGGRCCRRWSLRLPSSSVLPTAFTVGPALARSWSCRLSPASARRVAGPRPRRPGCCSCAASLPSVRRLVLTMLAVALILFLVLLELVVALVFRHAARRRGGRAWRRAAASPRRSPSPPLSARRAGALVAASFPPTLPRCVRPAGARRSSAPSHTTRSPFQTLASPPPAMPPRGRLGGVASARRDDSAVRLIGPPFFFRAVPGWRPR